MSKTKNPRTPEGAGETGAGTRNRTGISLAPEMALDLIREAQRTEPDSPGDARVLAEYRATYIGEKQVMGSRPLPRGGSPDDPAASLLLDKLGERLAFERQGTRLYEALIGKAKLLPAPAGGPSLRDLEHILSEERGHFRFLQQAVVEAGGDPTALTPCANVAAVLSQGVVQILTDPRTTLAQCLEAILLAELADNDGWSLLKQVAQGAGNVGLLERIEEAEAHEMEHLEKVRGWLSALVAGRGNPGKAPAKPAAKAAVKATAKAPARAKSGSAEPTSGSRKAGSRDSRIPPARGKGRMR